jgi:predicted enzyme related to lactoylglutathione lyase
MPRVVHFDIEAENPEKVREFYEGVFGWKFDKWEGPMEYWMIKTGRDEDDGIDGGLARKSDEGPAPSNTIDVASIDEAIRKIQEKGGEILTPKMPIPGIGWTASFRDPGGNMFGLMEEDETAGME